MSDFGRRFDPSELLDGDAGGVGAATETELLAVARDLEAFARSESVSLSVDFEDRVMAAIALEPPPRAAGGVGLGGLVAAVRDSWRLTWSGGRPLAVRAQALTLVVLAAVALGSLGALAAVGVGRLLAPEQPTVTPAPLPTPHPSILPSRSPEASHSPSPTPTASPTPTVEATETAEPTQAARPTSDSSGSGSGGSGSGSGGDSSGPGSGSSDDSSGSGSGSGETAKPTETPGGDSSGRGSGEDVPGSG
jgi:hypothetical protein